MAGLPGRELIPRAGGSSAGGARVRRALAAGAVACGLSAAGCVERAPAVTVYTSLEEGVAKAVVDAFRRDHPELRVVMEILAPGDALARLAAERDQPAADLWLGPPSWWLARGAGAGLLAGARPTWADGVPPEMRDGEGRWTGLLADPLVLAFGTEALSRSRAPRDWIDLLHPRWSGEIVVVEPGAVDGGTALLAWHMWEAHARWGHAQQGLDWFARLDAWRRDYVADASEAVRRLQVGDGMLAILPLSAAEAAREAGGVDYRFPESETPAVILGVGRVRRPATGAPQPGDPAGVFLEWLGTPEAVAALTGRAPRLSLAGATGEPGAGWVARAPSGVLPVTVPADSVAPLLDEWVGTWRTEVRGRATTLF